VLTTASFSWLSERLSCLRSRFVRSFDPKMAPWTIPVKWQYAARGSRWHCSVGGQMADRNMGHMCDQPHTLRCLLHRYSLNWLDLLVAQSQRPLFLLSPKISAHCLCISAFDDQKCDADSDGVLPLNRERCSWLWSSPRLRGW
jgi:hypothetical protein